MTYYQQQLKKIRKSHLPPKYIYIQVRQSKDFIDTYYARPILLKEMSGAAFFSKYHFIRLFKQIYGKTPHQYLRDVRIEQAKKLLRQMVPVSDACFAVGYNSLSTFSGFFKRAVGQSPSSYQMANFAILKK